MSEQAADALMRLAPRVKSPTLRSSCFDGLENIRRFLDGLEAWDRRKAERSTRDSAVVELLGLLDAPEKDVRAQAARALGTLGAVEQMPRLVRLLRDESTDVRAAAQEALDRLNAAPPAGKPGPGAVPADTPAGSPPSGGTPSGDDPPGSAPDGPPPGQ